MATRLEAGQHIDGFRLDEAMTAGGLGSLWRVSRADIDFPMIMKFPLLRRGETPLAIVGFEVEQMILPRLSGPHVPRFVAAGDFDGPYIVMEFIAGQALTARERALPLGFDEVATIGADIAAALHAIHRQNVLHLDLKPENIIFRDSGEAVLIDFGLARHLQLPDLPAEEFDGPVGSGAYVSPEQVLEIRNDPRSDIFALGVILYHLATAEFPFGEPSRAAEWRRRLYYDPPPPRRWRPDCPPWLQEVILHCLETDPGARYQTAAQLALDLLHPNQVALTARATRTRGSGAVTALRRWLRGLQIQPYAPAARLAITSPIVAVAIDLADGRPQLAEALRIAVIRVLQTEPDARLACINVFKLARLKLDEFEDESGANIHLRRLSELKHWAHAIPLAAERITFHVIEAVDAGAALVEFARRNHVDHIVMGARSSSTLRRYLGSVSAQVAAEAPCTVTVVRER